MPLLVPYVAAPSPYPTPTVTSPGFNVAFITSTSTVYISTVLAVQTSIGRTSPRVDGTAAGQAAITVDDTARVLDPDNTSSPLYGKLTPGGSTTVQLTTWDGTNWIPLFTGLIENITTSWPGGMDYSEAVIQLVDSQRDLNLAIPKAGTVYPQQQTGARIAALLGVTSRSGWGWVNRAPSRQVSLDVGQKVLGPLTTDGTTSAWSYLADAASAEKGLAFFNGGGVLTFHDQTHRYRTDLVKWSFADDQTGVPYDPDATLVLPNDRIVTDVAYTTTDGVTSVYGKSGASVGDPTVTTGTAVQLADSYQGAARARWEYERYTVNRRDAPQLTINSLLGWAENVVYPGTNYPGTFYPAGGGGWVCATQAQISDYVKFTRTPGSGVPITRYYWIDGIAHDIAYDHWKTTFTLLSADPIVPGWRLGVDKLNAPLTSDVCIRLSW